MLRPYLLGVAYLHFHLSMSTGSPATHGQLRCMRWRQQPSIRRLAQGRAAWSKCVTAACNSVSRAAMLQVLCAAPLHGPSLQEMDIPSQITDDSRASLHTTGLITRRMLEVDQREKLAGPHPANRPRMLTAAAASTVLERKQMDVVMLFGIEVLYISKAW
eukprot:4102796-Amphidinium_carterae.1